MPKAVNTKQSYIQIWELEIQRHLPMIHKYIHVFWNLDLL